MAYFSLKRIEYNDLSGQLITARGGFLSIQSTSGGDAISLPVIWGRLVRGTRVTRGIDPDENFNNIFNQQPTQVYWWQLRSLSSSSEGGNGGDGVPLTPTDVSTAPGSEVDWLLALGYNDQLAPFIKTTSPINFQSNDPIADNSIFNRLFAKPYKVSEVQEVAIAQPGDNPVESVPEPTSNLGAVVIGAIAIGLAVKRKLSRSVSISTNKTVSAAIETHRG